MTKTPRRTLFTSRQERTGTLVTTPARPVTLYGTGTLPER
jgi:hypothetical protein